MRSYINITLIILLQTVFVFGQNWKLIDELKLENKGLREFKPLVYKVFEINDQEIKKNLWLAPHERDTDVRSSRSTLTVGLADGANENFKIVQYDMMEPELANKYPEIRTFYGISTINSLKRIRIDYGHHGFRAVISSVEGKIFIDHFQRNDLSSRIVYFKKDYPPGAPWSCGVDSIEDNGHSERFQSGSRIGDCQLRSYRLAQAANGEYSNYHGATSSAQSGLVMTAVVNVINRVNEVYEAEVAVRLLLVANTNDLFYYSPSSDPYTNGNGSTMLGENISTCNSVIGSSNYDIGHVFSTGGGGVAYLGAVCGSNKAGGVTGQAAPIGDPFTIDYVAHEMGHQFGGNHTQYNNCNRSANSAMEPGSASTIMGYAGICSPNVQNNSDAYFHARSLQEIKTFINTGSSCETIVTSFVNNAPVVTSQPNYSIPISTPFVLTLTATDPNGNPMTYAWEQMNAYSAPAQTMPPASTNTTGPTFRSIIATTSPSRFFPPLANVIANTTNTWQVLPSVARSISYRGVVRDFTGVAGCNSEINITVSTVNAAAGPFSVTSFNTASTWIEGETKTITWNVAGTTASPVSAANVDILLSLDGGNTYPITLASATPNNGNHDIIVPLATTSQGRIMVKGTNHIFFDINNANLTIGPSIVTFSLSANPTTLTKCAGTTGISVVSASGTGGFSSPITLSASGLPSGATANFSVNPILPGQSSTLTINNLVTSGSFTVITSGNSGSINKAVNISLTVNPLAAAPNLVAPTNLATNVSINPNLSWNTSSGATAYDVQVAYDNAFTDIVFTNNQTGTNYIVISPLVGSTVHHWRVRAYNNCGPGAWSASRSFTTESCWIYNGNDLPISISATGTPTIESILNVNDRGLLTDLNILNLTGFHSKINNLKFTIIEPSNSNVLFWNQPCGKTDMDFSIGFDDSAASNLWPCPPIDGLTYIPQNPLATLITNQIKGNWRLQIEDIENLNGGSLQTWGIKTCVTDFCRLTVDHTRSDGPGSLKAAVDCAINGDTIRFASNIMNTTIALGNQSLVTNKSIFIESSLVKNINITSTNTIATIINNIPVGNQTLKIKGLYIHSSNSNVGAINNFGNLILEDVVLYKWAGSSTATINNQIGANTTLIGNCQVKPN